MIAMQYTITLPGDYDMGRIERRIRDKGPLFDGFEGLVFKAFLSARQADGAIPAQDNLYAPFYLWDRAESAAAFLSGSGFAGLARDFGRPAVKTWLIWHADIKAPAGQARFATRWITPVPAGADLATLQTKAAADVQHDIEDRGALASVTGFDPDSWTMVRFLLWPSPPTAVPDDSQAYMVGHVSPGSRSALLPEPDRLAD